MPGLLLATAGAGLVCVGRGRGERRLAPLAAALLAVFSFIKGTLLFYALLAVGIATVARLCLAPRSARARGRWVRGMGGFLIRPLPATALDLMRFAAGESLDAPPVTALRLVDNPDLHGLVQPRWHYRFTRVPPPGGDREAARKVLAELGGPYRESLGAAPQSVRSTGPIQSVQIDGQPFLLVHVTGEIIYQIPPGAHSIRGRFAILPGAWQRGGNTDGVEFRLEYQQQPPASSDNGSAGEEPPPERTVLFDRLLDPRAHPERDGPPQTFQVPLPPNVADGGRIYLRTLPGPANDNSWDWSCWSAIEFH